MRIATFNLESLEPVSRGGVSLEARAAVLRPQLLRLDADVLCLQEVNGQRVPGAATRSLRALDMLVADTPYAGYHRVATTAPHGGVADVHNLVILSRPAIVAHREIRHAEVQAVHWRKLTAVPPQADAEPVTFERPILMAEIDAGAVGRLVVLNVHFRAPLASPIPGQKESSFVWRTVRGWAEGYFLSALKRNAQALELRLVVDGLLDRDPDALIAVCGDFNAEDHDTPLKIAVGAEEDTGNGLLAPRSLVVLDRALSADRRFSVIHHGRPQMLDHILVSRALLARFLQMEAHNETLPDEIVAYGRTDHATGSYHAPLLATFRPD